MYEKTLTKGTTKVNNAYEWQKVSYTNKDQTTTTPTTSPKTKQQKSSKKNNNKKTILNSANNATKAHTEHLNATPTTKTPGTLTVPSSVKPATQTPLFKKFVGNAARRQTLAHQIKRAHRHLLTSGGNDKQPQKQTRNNNSRKCKLKQTGPIAVQNIFYIIYVFYVKKYVLHCILEILNTTAQDICHMVFCTCVWSHSFSFPAIDIGICRPADLHGLYRQISISIYCNINNSHIKQVAAQLLQDSSRQKQQNSSNSGRVTNT